jgi:lysozyme family protein
MGVLMLRLSAHMDSVDREGLRPIISALRGHMAARIGWCVTGVIASVALTALSSHPTLADEGRRVALVIGNGQYAAVGALTNPVNDATGMGAALKRLGFSEVKIITEANYNDMRLVLSDFSKLAQDAELALIFYAGHGMEIAGQSYLIPVDAKLARAKDADIEAVPLRTVQATLEDIKGTGVIILDACRNNPFISRMVATGGTRAISAGLARPTTRGNSLIVYSARDGTTAADGTGVNSPFTTALLKSIEQPLEIDLLFRTVRDEVIVATGPDEPQEPFTYGSLSAKPIYFRDKVQPGQPAPGSAPSTEPLRREPTLDEYRTQFRTAVLDPKVDANVEAYKKMLNAGRERYDTVAQATGVPWMVIGILHVMETGGNFRTHLFNGDPLTARTVNVPVGRPLEGTPPFTWEQSAIAAIKFEKWDVRTKIWTVEDTMSAFEKYNGFGARRRGVVSPYLWSGSNLYRSGKFVADGVWEPTAVSKQIGAAVLLKYAVPVQEIERRLNYRGE